MVRVMKEGVMKEGVMKEVIWEQLGDPAEEGAEPTEGVVRRSRDLSSTIGTAIQSIFEPRFRTQISNPDFEPRFRTQISNPDFEPRFRTQISNPDFERKWKIRPFLKVRTSFAAQVSDFFYALAAKMVCV
jgi:hypothetical protein